MIMAVYLPDGSTVALATTYAAKTITAISNANPAVVSCTAHGLTDGDLIELTSGWSRLNGRTFRVASSLTDTFALEDVDTTDTAVFAAGSGVGTFKEISAWTSVTQILKFEVSGGRRQFTQGLSVSGSGFLNRKCRRSPPQCRSISRLPTIQRWMASRRSKQQAKPGLSERWK